MAHRTSGMIANAVDNESMVVLAQPSSLSQPTSNFNNSLENTVVNCLASDIAASDISPNSNIPLVLEVTNNYTVTNLSAADRNSFDLQTTNDVSDISFAMISQYDSTVQPAPDSYSCDIGTSNIPVNIFNSIILPSASIYDSNVTFSYQLNTLICPSTSDNANSVYPIDMDGTIPNQGPWEASFDNTNSNVNYSRAVNSEHNTNGYRPLSVNENTVFNKEHALGNDFITSNQQNFFTLDYNGKPIANAIDTFDASSEQGYMAPSFLMSDNGVIPSKSENFPNISLNDYGSYRFQQFPDEAVITIVQDDIINNSTSQSSISNFPIFNSNAEQPLLTNKISIDTFFSLFERDNESPISEIILPDYRYKIHINEALDGSGYSVLHDIHEHTVVNTFTLDDDELLDNAVYMEHYVNGNHNLEFTEGGLNITPLNEDVSPDNIEYAFSLNTEREYITKSNFANGQIKINNNAPTTRTETEEQSNLSNVNPNVFYNLEDSNYESISSELQQNAFVAYQAQLVAKNSKDINGSFMKNTGNKEGEFALDLYTNSKIVNSNFNQSDFSFIAPTPNDVQAEVFKITPLKQLISVNGFGSMNNGVSSPMSEVAISANLTGVETELINNDNVFDKVKMTFSLKDLEGSSIQNAVSNADGWSITSKCGDKIGSSSQMAFSAGNVSFPSQDDTIGLINGDIEEISYRISISTAKTGLADNSTLSGHLQDFITFEWSKDNFISDVSSIFLNQDLITRNSSNHTFSPLNEESRVTKDFNLNGKLKGKSVNLYKKDSTRTITFTAELPIRPFDGLTLTSPPVTVITRQHILVDKNTGDVLPPSSLKYVTDSDSENPTDYSRITEEFSEIPYIEGKLTAADLCDMILTVVKIDTDEGDSAPLSDKIPISSMYGITKQITLYDTSTLEVSLEVPYMDVETGQESIVGFDNLQGYEAQLTSSYDTNYICEYWTANTDDIIYSTNIQSSEETSDYSDKVLTVINGYNNINSESWNSNDYEVVVSYEDDNSTTVLSIRQKNTSFSLYEIRTKNFTYLNSTAFISNFPKDIFRNNRWIGQKGSDNQIYFTEKFIQVDYTYTNGEEEDTQSNIFQLDAGVYLTATDLNSTTFTQPSDIGKLIKFNLLPDSIGVNMINSVNNLYPVAYENSSSESNHTVSNYGLTFQYVDENSNSRKFTIDRYRGFYGSDEQLYTIERAVMVATLSISKLSDNESYPDLISQSWDVYQDELYTVDNLSNNCSSFGGIGLKITFLFSMLSDDEINNYTVFTKGDDVSFDIVNPYAELLSYRPAPLHKTLLSFALDKFSGSNFNNSEMPYSINSKRLKIRTSNSSNPFLHSSASWSILLQFGDFRIYKNDNYLGNPANLDTNDAYSPPDSSKWTDTTPEGETYTFKTLVDNGVSVANWIFKRININYDASISYGVIFPPTLYFTSVYSDTKPLPYNVNEQNDLRSSYLIVSPTDTYNPFAPSTTYNYIAPTDEVSSVTVSFDQNLANNITFEQTDSDTLASYIDNERDVATQYFVVEGNKLTMSLKAGLKSQNGSNIVNLFESLPANRLKYLVNNLSSFYVNKSINSNSGIELLLQQPTNIPNTPYNLPTGDIYSTGASINGNITIQIDNFFGKNTFALDLPAGAGTKVNLYTREMVQDGLNYKVYIYKYKSINNVDYNDVNPSGTSIPNNLAIPLTFLERSYKEIVINTSDFINYVLTLSHENIKIAFGTYVQKHVQESISNLNSQNWILDTTWPTSDSSDIYNSVYATLVSYSSGALKSIVPKVFATTFDGKSKAFYVSKHPIFTVLDKLGRVNYQITNSGTTITPNISTGNTIYNASSNVSPSRNLDNSGINHISTNKKNNMAI